ncbi:ABC transporter permease [Brevibacillus sp. HB1.1]|uniref:ABC transporter permease n=1 Tax=Brevibacillus sp. HB1.1 TaxID=2738808 RepID=UPI00157771D5|nr:ABC transporter permease [Brevibacillus sp. HB1.1]NTU31100.1 ABC transporter permease [Brevibacillus sp. HB1.1]
MSFTLQNRYNSDSISFMRFLNPVIFAKTCWSQRLLIKNLAIREIQAKYKDSYLGILWSFIHPLFLLTIYTFVFSVVFKAKWGTNGGQSTSEFAMMLFSGLIVFNIFSELANRSPSLIINNSNYVKKVIFPLEVLPVSVLFSVLTNFLISFTIFVIGQYILLDYISPTIFMVPIVLLPLIMISLGISYLLASLGVYIRDVAQSVGIVVNMLFFLTPVFYPVTAVPKEFQYYMNLNPLTYLISVFRDTVFNGVMPDLLLLTGWIAGGFVFLIACYAWFMVTRRGFADVI